MGAGLSRTVDEQRAADREASRLDRLERAFADLQKVTRLRKEGLTFDVIAVRMGWSLRTLERWWRAAKLVDRKGIKMSQGSTNP